MEGKGRQEVKWHDFRQHCKNLSEFNHFLDQAQGAKIACPGSCQGAYGCEGSNWGLEAEYKEKISRKSPRGNWKRDYRWRRVPVYQGY